MAKKGKFVRKVPAKKAKPKKSGEKKESELVPTDIPGFDQLVDGGFRRGSINLIAGHAGSGKTIFATQFLLNGIIKHNEPGIYITFEEKKDKFFEDVKCFGYDAEKLEKEGSLIYLEYTPEQVRNVLIEGGGIIDNIITKKKIKRLVIDSITSFSLLYEDELSRKEAALALFDLINKWGCTAVLTSQNETDREDMIKVSLEFEVDSVIFLYHTKKKGERIRALEVLKMRRTKHAEKTVGFEITSRGISVNPKKVVQSLV